MRVQEELKEEEKRSQFRVEGILTLEEQGEDRGQYRLRRRPRESRDGSACRTLSQAWLLSVDSHGANLLDWKLIRILKTDPPNTAPSALGSVRGNGVFEI